MIWVSFLFSCRQRVQLAAAGELRCPRGSGPRTGQIGWELYGCEFLDFSPSVSPVSTGRGRNPPLLAARVHQMGFLWVSLRGLCPRVPLPRPTSSASHWHHGSGAEQGLWPELVQFYFAHVGWKRLGLVVRQPRVYGFSPKNCSGQVWGAPALLRGVRTGSQYPALLCQGCFW